MITDADARVFGMAVIDQTLKDFGQSRVGSTRFADWLGRSST